MAVPIKRGSGRSDARLRLAALLAGVSLSAVAAHAQDATWLPAPATSDWNTPANWSPATVPTGTAFFGASNTTSLTFAAAATSIGTMQFNTGAPAYTFTLNNRSLSINGNGITNGSPTIIDLLQR